MSKPTLEITEIPGIKRFGERVERFAPSDAPDLAVFVTNIEFDRSTREPALIVGRRVFGRGRAVIIPLSSAWQYDMPDMIADKVYRAATVLYIQPTKSEATKLMDVILRFLPNLYKWAPERTQTKNEWENQMARLGLQLKDSEGNVLLDMSGAGRG